MKKLANVLVPFLLICLLTSGCSVIMAANRSSYRGDVNVMQLGVQRTVVIGELGQPDKFSELENGGYDDWYTLDPHAHRTWTRVLAVICYAVADFFTWFLSQFIGTPMELSARDRLVVYHLTYGPDGTLSSLEKSEPNVAASAQ